MRIQLPGPTQGGEVVNEIDRIVAEVIVAASRLDFISRLNSLYIEVFDNSAKLLDEAVRCRDWNKVVAVHDFLMETARTATTMAQRLEEAA